MLIQFFVLNVLLKKKKHVAVYIVSGYFSFSRLISWLWTMFLIIDVQIVKEDAEPLKNFPGEPKMPARWARFVETHYLCLYETCPILSCLPDEKFFTFFSPHA